MVFGNMAGLVITVLLWLPVMTLAWPSVPGSMRFVSSFLNGLASPGVRLLMECRSGADPVAVLSPITPVWLQRETALSYIYHGRSDV
ncbi:MAG: hypothetical protein ABI604_14420 [Nitrospirota bacterium]